jgi:hypothetical protein
MRHFLVKWLILCSFLLGLQARLFAHDPCEVMAKLHAAGQCQVDHGECPAGGSDHDGQCPADHHHHHGICGHATPYPADETAALRLNLPCSSSLRLRHEGDEIPDGPCLEEDIPPII